MIISILSNVSIKLFYLLLINSIIDLKVNHVLVVFIGALIKDGKLLLADVFEQLRASCLKTYNLVPAHYYTLPGLTWDVLLKHTKQKLEILTDQGMFLFVERSIRGGQIQVCSKRRVRGNNKYMSNYNSSMPDSYIMHFDAINKYGLAMS